MPRIDQTPATCFDCGYDLRGLADDARCPECGTPAQDSRRRWAVVRSDRLPRRLRAATGWCLLVAAAAGCLVVAYLVFFLVTWGSTGFLSVLVAVLTLAAGATAASVFAAQATLCLTRGGPATPTDAWTRTSSVALAVATVLAVVGGVGVSLFALAFVLNTRWLPVNLLFSLVLPATAVGWPLWVGLATRRIGTLLEGLPRAWPAAPMRWLGSALLVAALGWVPTMLVDLSFYGELLPGVLRTPLARRVANVAGAANALMLVPWLGLMLACAAWLRRRYPARRR